MVDVLVLVSFFSLLLTLKISHSITMLSRCILPKLIINQGIIKIFQILEYLNGVESIILFVLSNIVVGIV